MDNRQSTRSMVSMETTVWVLVFVLFTTAVGIETYQVGKSHETKAHCERERVKAEVLVQTNNAEVKCIEVSRE